MIVGRVFAHLWRGFGVDLAMDLGTANTLVYRKGEGIIINEPSVVARDRQANRTVAVGKKAARYVGRNPEWMIVGRPLKDGVIADFDGAMAMIRGFLAKAFTPRLWRSCRIVIGIPSGTTQVEKRAVRESAYEAGAKEIFLMEEPMAAALGAGADVADPSGFMIVDIGGGTTEVAVIALGTTTHWESTRVAGDEMDAAIVRYLQQQMRIEISSTLAEQIKIRVGCALELREERSMDVTGKELGKGVARTVTLTSSEMRKAVTEPVGSILDTVRRALERLPPALLSDISERGIILSGGGALLSGLDRLISRFTGIPVFMADDPLTTVVRGCGMAIEDPRRWRNVFVN
ncbi:MAG: rod shape-determining protein [Thermodesulfobacteriota bacterium]